jgi:hypothetical protein
MDVEGEITVRIKSKTFGHDDEFCETTTHPEYNANAILSHTYRLGP